MEQVYKGIKHEVIYPYVHMPEIAKTFSNTISHSEAFPTIMNFRRYTYGTYITYHFFMADTFRSIKFKSIQKQLCTYR